MIKQYVNLPYDAGDHHGNYIQLLVQAFEFDRAEDFRYAEWWVDPVGAANTDYKYLSRGSRVRVRRRITRNRDVSFSNRLYLPHVGGDKYQVKCSKRGDRSDTVELEEIQTWRKIYYTVHYMNANCRRFFNRVKNRFKTAFEEGYVELEEVAVNPALVDEPKTRATNFLRHLYRRRPRLSDRPFHLRIVVLNDIYERVGKSYTLTRRNSKRFEFGTNTPLSDTSATNWLRSAKARIEPRGRWRNIRSMTSKVDERHIRVDVSTHRRLSEAIDNGDTIEVRVKTRERNHYCGHSIGNFCCVRINEPGSDADIERTILQTFTHEVGHGLQQVVRRERTYNAAGRPGRRENNPKWYDDRYGGQGPHCNLNAKLIASRTTTSRQVYTHDSGTLCTMFHRSDAHVDADGKFCATCLERLKRVKLNAGNMRRQGWNQC